MKTETSKRRLEYLDWVRGIGALIMLQGHVFDSFLRPELRPGGPYMFSQFLGGMPPAIFLFLTGVTLAFLMDSSERKGLGPRDRVFTAFRRCGYLFFLAFAFRLEMWLSQFFAPTSDLFRVDILNCMGFGIAILSVMALFRTAERARLCAVLGFAIALLSPLVSQMNWSWAPLELQAYLIPDHRFFGFFPWAAYLAFGVSTGSAIRVIPQDALERAMQWLALASGALILICRYCADLPYSFYAKSDYWLNSPAQILTKQCVTFLLVCLAFVWTRYVATSGWSWVRQLGTTSLLVYWVHIELVYGRWLWFFKNNLTVPETIAIAVLVIGLMLGLSTLRTYHRRARAALAEMGWWFGAKPDRVSGD